MADEWRTIKLQALLSRGPWATSHEDQAVHITRKQVEALYDAIRARVPDPTIYADLGQRSTRPSDRALTLLKKAGLIRYDREQGKWVAC